MTRRRSRRRRDVEPADLRGLPTRRYVRESTPGQALEDRNGPALQRADIDRFVAKHELEPPDHEYFDASSGKTTAGRPGLQAALRDAEAGQYRVLLCYNTSRSFRNAEDATIWKGKFRRAGVTLVFTEPELISGNHRTRWQEGIQAIADAERSAEQGRMIGGGLRQKFERGLHNGTVPLGYSRYRGEPGDPRNGELLADETGARTVRAIVEQYLTGRFSVGGLTAWLNAQVDGEGQALYRTRRGRRFTKGSVEEILRNRVYRGEVVWHPGTPEEEWREGRHEALITAEEWEQIAALRARATRRRGASRGTRRVYPLSGPACCSRCGASYHGDTSGNHQQRRLRHSEGIDCPAKKSFAAAALEAQFATLLTERFRLPRGWERKVAQVVAAPVETPAADNSAEQARLEAALANLRKLFTWGDVAEADYLRQKRELEQQLARLSPDAGPVRLDDVHRAAELLRDVGRLWANKKVSPQERRDFVDAMVEELLLDENGIAALRPRPEFGPVLAVAARTRKGGFGRGERI